jgi:hypothetical protein
MKKLITIGSLVLMGFSSSFANGGKDGLSKDVNYSFQHEFANSKMISWVNSNGYIKVTFSQDGVILYAYFDQNAELLAVSRNILSNQLPISLMLNLKKDYRAYWITDLFQIDSHGDQAYYASMENADYRIVIRSTDGFSWQIFSREKKETE